MKIITHVTLIAGEPAAPATLPPGTYDRADLAIDDGEIESLRERGLLSVADDDAPARAAKGDRKK